jgi:hypothetical protein
MDFQSIFAWNSLPEAGFSKNVVIDAHQRSGSCIHLNYPNGRGLFVQGPVQTLASIHAKRPPQSGFVLTGYPEVMPRNKLSTTQTRSRLRGRCLPLSDVFQSEIVVHGMAEFLLAAEIALGCLNRCVSKQELNLLKFSAC